MHIIPRICYKQARLVAGRGYIASTNVSAATPPSGSSGGTSSGSSHPHAQFQDTPKQESSSDSSPESSASEAFSNLSRPEASTSSQGSSSRSSFQTSTNAISIPIQVPSDGMPHIIPFHTYQFFCALEKSFPTPIARTLMKATRGMLVDRMLKIRRDGLDAKDLDNQAYLFRAALSELRTEATMRTKNQAASISTSLGGLRRDLDIIDVKMKEDIGELKHEIQMEMDSHRNESRADIKRRDITMEEVVHGAMIKISDIRTEIEQAKWDNTRRGVAIFAGFVVVVIMAMEMRPTRKQPYPPKAAVEAAEAIDVDPVQSTT